MSNLTVAVGILALAESARADESPQASQEAPEPERGKVPPTFAQVLQEIRGQQLRAKREAIRQYYHAARTDSDNRNLVRQFMECLWPGETSIAGYEPSNATIDVWQRNAVKAAVDKFSRDLSGEEVHKVREEVKALWRDPGQT